MNEILYPALLVESEFFGYDTIVSRSVTEDAPAYNYSIHMLKLEDGTYEAYTGGRWKSGRGDGDHILKFRSDTGEPCSWRMAAGRRFGFNRRRPTRGAMLSCGESRPDTTATLSPPTQR